MKNLILVFSYSILLISCSKNNFVNGTVKDFGEPAADGCGWVIEIGNEIFKPINLDAQFEQDQLPIRLDYQKLNSKANCGFQIDAYDEIEILAIE